MVLHGNELVKDADVAPGVFFTTEKSKIELLLKDPLALARYFVGYAGWGASQLEAEMETESWIVTDACADQILHEHDDLWVHLMRRQLLGQFMDASRIPDDPTVN